MICELRFMMMMLFEPEWGWGNYYTHLRAVAKSVNLPLHLVACKDINNARDLSGQDYLLYFFMDT